MPKLQFVTIDPIQTPLVNKLYKDYYPAGKANKSDRIWIVKDHTTWVGSVKYRDYDEFTFMSAMLIVPDRRGQGIAQQLLTQSLINNKVNIYCFAYSYLENLYRNAGFKVIESTHLPASLKQRFERYTQHGRKTLIPMQYSVAECE